MKVSMWMLCDALEDICLRHNLDDRSKRICIKGILPYMGPENVSDAYLYVADTTGGAAPRLPETPCYLAFAGENSLPEGTGACQYIVLRPSCSYAAALFEVSKAFEKYADWIALLQDELSGAQDLNRFCTLGRQMLENFTMLYNRDYTIIAGDFILDSVRYDKNGLFYALSPGALRQLKNSASFQQSFRQNGAALMRADFLPYGVLYVNLSRGSAYEGRLCVTEQLRPFKNGDYQLAEILTEFIRAALKRQATRTSDEGRRFEAFVLKMLDGFIPGDSQLDAALSLWHWKRFGRYVCLRAGQNALDEMTSSDVYLVSRIALSLPGSCAVRHGGGIVCIVSLSEKEAPEDVAAALSRLLGGFIPYIGVSEVYSDFMDTAQYYKQAAIAAETGARSDKDSWCHYFRDYAMAHYFMYGTSVLPAIHFCHGDVRRLMAYQGARTDYYNTLKVYLENNMNLLETAKALFIHRTTLFNRISRIRELIASDLDNPGNRTRMLISFKLMETDALYGQGDRKVLNFLDGND